MQGVPAERSAAGADDAGVGSSALPTSIATQGAGSPSSISPASRAAASIAKDELQLLAFNKLADVTSDSDFRRLVDDANMAATKGGDEQEKLVIARLIGSRDYAAAANELLAIAQRPGGVTTFVETDLPKALRREGRLQEAAAFETEIGLRTLQTLERMEELGLGEAAPVVFDITFWRANQYLKRGTPEWRRAFESLARVGARIPDNSAALHAGYVRSLGLWAGQTLERFDAQERAGR